MTKLITQGSHNSDKTTPFSNLPIKFGNGSEAGVENYTGVLDDFKLFNYPLTQITNLYNE